MRVTAVESRTLATVAYDETRELLQLEFRSRGIYQYSGVSAGMHESLLLAPSKGSYFNRVIRGRYPYCLVWNVRIGGREEGNLAEGPR
jgi:hypothetical protein